MAMRALELSDINIGAILDVMVHMLNTEGYTTKTGKPFHPMQVNWILDRCALYEGRYRYAGIESEGQYKAILWATYPLTVSAVVPE